MDEAYRGHDCALGNSGGFLFFEAVPPGQELPRRIELAWIAMKHKAQFEAWCKSLALAELAVTKKITDAETYRDNVSAYQRDVLAGEYAWARAAGSILARKLATEEGCEQLGFLLARDRDPNMTAPLFHALVEAAPEAFTLVLNEVFRHPNSDTPWGRTVRTAVKEGLTLEQAQALALKTYRPTT